MDVVTGVPVVVVMRVVMAVLVVVVMVVMVIPMVMMMPVVMIVVMAVHLHLSVSASANRTHHAASKSLIRISSPPCGISLPPPQSGQGSSRWAISTTFMQS